jgi:NifU-like protein involved in Fe-S cluster formation
MKKKESKEIRYEVNKVIKINEKNEKMIDFKNHKFPDEIFDNNYQDTIKCFVSTINELKDTEKDFKIFDLSGN